MANVLTTSEAATVLRCETTDADMLNLLPMVDAYLKQATGRDWTADTTIYNEAKSAARMLLVIWHENPAMIGSGITALNFGLAAVLMQLQVLAMTLETSGVPDEALELLASNPAEGADDVAITISAVLVFNHEMATGAISNITLEDANGNAVTVSNTLDATKKIMTINPTANLAAGSEYTIVISDAADIYGGTISEEISFVTA